MSFDDVLMVDTESNRGTIVQPDDILTSDELVHLSAKLGHTVSTITEDNPLYSVHLAFKKECEGEVVVLPLDDIKS
jgi:hypothetical protein